MLPPQQQLQQKLSVKAPSQNTDTFWAQTTDKHSRPQNWNQNTHASPTTTSAKAVSQSTRSKTWHVLSSNYKHSVPRTAIRTPTLAPQQLQQKRSVSQSTEPKTSQLSSPPKLTQQGSTEETHHHQDLKLKTITTRVHHMVRKPWQKPSTRGRTDTDWVQLPAVVYK